MIVLIILLVLLVLILYFPVCLEVRYVDGNLSYRVYYTFITFYPKKREKRHRLKKKAVKSSSKKSKGNTSNKERPPQAKRSNIEGTKPTDDGPDGSVGTEKQSKPTDKGVESNPDMDFFNTINMLLDVFKAIKVNLGKFIKSLKVTNLYIDFKVANQDAYDCALKFGKMNILLYNVLGYLERNFKVKKEFINIQPKYNSSDSVYNISFKIKLGFGSGISKILVMVFKVIPILKENDVI